MKRLNHALLTALGVGFLGLACSGTEDPGGNGGSGSSPGSGATSGTGSTTGSGSTSSGGSGDPASGGAGVDGNSGGAGPLSGGSPGAGGDGTGIPGSGGSDPGAPEPELVTSGPGAYWQVGELTPGGAAATVTVTSSATKQAWHGFGGTFNEKGWTALLALSEADRAAAIRLLFDVNGGIGFTWGRIPIGPSDYANERYTLSSGPDNFSIAHDEETLMPYIKAAQAVKNDIKFWGSPWSPPPWAKTGATENQGHDKGLFNTEYFEEYAQYFVNWIEGYEDNGIPIDHVQPQNEPGFSQSYPTCAFGPSQDTVANGPVYADEPVTLGDFVDAHLFPALDGAGLDTKVWYGTLSNDTYFNAYWGDMSNKASAERIVGVGLQWGTQGRIGALVNAGYLVMQTEHKCGNYPWLGPKASSADDANRDNFLENMAPNNHAYGEESWDLIKSWIDDGVNIYSAWNMVLDTKGFNLDMVRPWPQNALLAVDTVTKELKVTPTYYVFRHVAQYVEPGATVLTVQGGNALAFKNPDNTVVTIMFNSGAQASETVLSIDGTLFTVSIPSRGWATVNYKG